MNSSIKCRAHFIRWVACSWAKFGGPEFYRIPTRFIYYTPFFAYCKVIQATLETGELTSVLNESNDMLIQTLQHGPPLWVLLACHITFMYAVILVSGKRKIVYLPNSNFPFLIHKHDSIQVPPLRVSHLSIVTSMPPGGRRLVYIV